MVNKRISISRCIPSKAAYPIVTCHSCDTHPGHTCNSRLCRKGDWIQRSQESTVKLCIFILLDHSLQAFQIRRVSSVAASHCSQLDGVTCFPPKQKETAAQQAIGGRSGYTRPLESLGGQRQTTSLGKLWWYRKGWS